MPGRRLASGAGHNREVRVMRHRNVVLVAVATVLTVGLMQPTAARADSSKSDPPGRAAFKAGAAAESITPPPFGAVPNDAADCAPPFASAVTFDGPRRFAFEEPYNDAAHAGTYQLGDPFVDCNGNGRWDGILLGGGADTPRFPTTVADPVTARALVVSNHQSTIAVEVLDQEGLFNVYQERIRAQVLADGYHLDGIFISATHDESAPDTLGISGVSQTTSGVDAYYVDFLVTQSARRSRRRTTNCVRRASSTRRRSSPPISGSASRRIRSSTIS